MSNKREWKVYKRPDGKYWWAYIKNPVPGEPGIRRSTGTVDKRQAEEWARQAAEQLWRQVRLGIEPDKTWEEAVVRWLKERKKDKTTIEEDKSKFRWLHPHLSGKKLVQITRGLVMDILTKKMEEDGTSHATFNRYVALISAVLKRAEKVWEWLEKAPSLYKFPERSTYNRYLTVEEADRLLNELPPHQRDPVDFALGTGLRQANVIELEWSEVDLVSRQVWVKGERFKNRNSHGIPLNDRAYDALLRQIGKHPTRVFTYKGEPLTQLNTRAWRKALKRAGIENFRWHDLRHTFFSWLAMSGATSVELQQIGGWRSQKMPNRYSHLSSRHLMNVVGRIDTFSARSSEKGNAENV